MMVLRMTNCFCRFKKYPVTDQRHYSVKMKQRQLIELQSWFLASIVLSASVFVPAYASPRPPQARNALGPDGVQDLIAGPGCLDCAVTGLESYRQQGRQDDGLGGIGSIISLGIKLAPTLIQLFNTLTSGSGSSDSSTSSSSSSSNTVDRVETTPVSLIDESFFLILPTNNFLAKWHEYYDDTHAEDFITKYGEKS